MKLKIKTIYIPLKYKFKLLLTKCPSETSSLEYITIIINYNPSFITLAYVSVC